MTNWQPLPEPPKGTNTLILSEQGVDDVRKAFEADCLFDELFYNLLGSHRAQARVIAFLKWEAKQTVKPEN